MHMYITLQYALVMALFIVGLSGVALCGNLMRKLMAMNVMQVSIIFLYVFLAYDPQGALPILSKGTTIQNHVFINPLPHTLMLTAIVVGVSTTGLGLALLIRLRSAYGSIEESDIRRKIQER